MGRQILGRKSRGAGLVNLVNNIKVVVEEEEESSSFETFSRQIHTDMI
jgi:hypothetical protein